MVRASRSVACAGAAARIPPAQASRSSGANLTLHPQSQDQVLEYARSLDKNGDGFVMGDELKPKAFVAGGDKVHVSEDELAWMIKKIDDKTNPDGKVSVEELAKHLADE
ncbi:hypothetical protein DFJ74DRAFT_701955 [Hyaloraphidium curvatum]|nr:hypothetical protein DFJ74DRAFT_701955 [Hyaloraphidium curvatum]